MEESLVNFIGTVNIDLSGHYFLDLSFYYLWNNLLYDGTFTVFLVAIGAICLTCNRFITFWQGTVHNRIYMLINFEISLTLLSLRIDAILSSSMTSIDATVHWTLRVSECHFISLAVSSKKGVITCAFPHEIDMLICPFVKFLDLWKLQSFELRWWAQFIFLLGLNAFRWFFHGSRSY